MLSGIVLPFQGGGHLDAWHATYLGRRRLPSELTAFELEAFFSFSDAERRTIEQRREPALRLSLALQIGFLRMSGRLLDAIDLVPSALWKHLGEQFGVAAPDVASLRAMYRRRKTLFDHQQTACIALGFRPMGAVERRTLVRELSKEAERVGDPERLLAFVRRRAYEMRSVIARDRDLRSMMARAIRLHEASLAKVIRHSVHPQLLAEWHALLVRQHDSTSVQHWLWAAPAKHSSRQIDEMRARYDTLCSVGVDHYLGGLSDVLLRRYARRLASRPPSVGARIKEPKRTIEVACFLRYCLLLTTDHLLLMVSRRVAELWRLADAEIDPKQGEWEGLYRELADEVLSVLNDAALSIDVVRGRLTSLLAMQQKRRPPARAELVRGRLIEGVRPVRALLRQLVDLPWRSTPNHPVTDTMATLNRLYAEDIHTLPVGFAARLGRVWQATIEGPDRERAFKALEVATVLNLRRALRNGTVWIEHSLTFRSRERLFFPPEVWKGKRHLYHQRLELPTEASAFLGPLVERAEEATAAVAEAAAKGRLRVDDDLHLTPLAAEDRDPRVAKLRNDLDDQIGEAQLPEIILDVDAQVHFSWIMLGREPRSSNELLMVYAGMLAHGTAMSAAETARMMPQVSRDSVRQAMRWASDEGRLAEARSAVLEFMQRHPIASSWGRSDLASSDMMSLETSRKVWQARIDPRRHTPAVGMYSHVRAFWGISHAQPIVLNERQAGAAIEGVVRDDRLETSQLAVDTHGYTEFAMALAKLLGFDLCPRLKALKERQLFLPVGANIPDSLRSICRASVDLERIEAQWDPLVHLTASVHTGNASAINVLNCFGSASRGDPLYEAGVHLGRLLRTVFLADYFVIEAFRRELLRVLNRGESVNALKRAIYAGRVASSQAKRTEEMQAVADALSLLANIVMAWNTARMQTVVDGWKLRGYVVPAELMGKVAPTRTEGINLRGVFRFPIELYADRLLPRAAKGRVAQS